MSHKLTTTPQYTSVKHYFAVNRLFHRDADNWRLTEPLIGEIHALPGSHGILVATNGMLCHIEQGKDSDNLARIFVGHLDNFIRWNGTQPTEITLKDGSTIPITAKRKAQTDALVLDYLTELQLV